VCGMTGCLGQVAGPEIMALAGNVCTGRRTTSISALSEQPDHVIAARLRFRPQPGSIEYRSAHLAECAHR
jgi:hypothetical protein